MDEGFSHTAVAYYYDDFVKVWFSTIWCLCKLMMAK